ncbi:hypothetical protein SAMN05192533_11528 [Mesobacillus persicus]|uniref:Uncharacterized protein n=1 Tax=Mesobacillus persicus TaxID=930146 RepID=A0A1H8HI61_9BACI|nr:hypothetical protein [Mesobacillus persicus]SEN55785.1 hypothetical protein SAMN05192533_11528 [Mesobacillus persicus]
MGSVHEIKEDGLLEEIVIHKNYKIIRGLIYVHVHVHGVNVSQ